MPMPRKMMSHWEVAEAIYERRAGMSWEMIASMHEMDKRIVKREVRRFAALAGRVVA